MQNAVRSGMGLLGMHPAASLSHPLHQAALTGQRMPGLLPLDVRPNLLQPGVAARFPLIMQQGPPQQAGGLLDNALQAHARAPFSQVDPFNRAPNLASENVSKTEDEPSSGADEGKDQDYRFPPLEKQSTGLLRTPPPDHRESLGGGGGGAGGGAGGRPALLQTPGSQQTRTSLVGRLQALAGFTPDNRWSQNRGDFDERDGMRGGPQAPGGPKGFQEERPSPGQNFPNRFDSRPGIAAGAAGASATAVGGPQAWNRSGAATAPFDSDLHQDLDERRRPWDRQRDRDEREFDFRREMNGNRHSRERERERERGRDRPREHERERERDKERDRERERERGGWTPLLPLPTPLLPTPPINPNLTLNQGKLLAPLKLNPQFQPRFQSPLLPQAQAKLPPIFGLNQPLPQAPVKSPPPSQSQREMSEPQSETSAQAQVSEAHSPPASPSPSDTKAQSPLTGTPTEAQAAMQLETPSQSLSEDMTQSPPKTISSPNSEASSQASSLVIASSQDSPVAFTQAASLSEETTDSQEEERPQTDQEESQERPSSPQSQWVNGPGMDSNAEAEPTPEASPDRSSNSVLPQSDPEPQEQLASPKDISNEQSEPMEEAASQPVVDTVTDTEGT